MLFDAARLLLLLLFPLLVLLPAADAAANTEESLVDGEWVSLDGGAEL